MKSLKLETLLSSGFYWVGCLIACSSALFGRKPWSKTSLWFYR